MKIRLVLHTMVLSILLVIKLLVELLTILQWFTFPQIMAFFGMFRLEYSYYVAIDLFFDGSEILSWKILIFHFNFYASKIFLWF